MSRQEKAVIGIAIIVAAIILLVLALTPPVRADGLDPTDKGAGYVQYSQSYSHRTTRAYSICPPRWRHLGERECRRIQAINDSRARARTRYVEPAPRRRAYVAEPRYSEPSYERPRAGRRCAGYFKVEGDARVLERLALGNARQEWRQQVRISERGGEPFMDERYSPDFRVGKCRIVGDRGINKRCTAEGTACRAD